MRCPLIAAVVAALAYGGLLTARRLRESAPPSAQKGRAFSLATAVSFAGMVAAMLFLSAALNALLGKAGVLAGYCGSGFSPTHMRPPYRWLPWLPPASSRRGNRCYDSCRAYDQHRQQDCFRNIKQGRRYAIQIIPGLVIVIGAAWAAAAFSLRH